MARTPKKSPLLMLVEERKEAAERTRKRKGALRLVAYQRGMAGFHPIHQRNTEA